MTETVRLQGVTKTYNGADAIRDATYSLKGGESIALVGHNGAGKTTMIKLMLGLIRPNAGEVRVLGEDPAAGQFAARRRLGYLPEHVSFNMALTGAETLSFYARLKGAPKSDIARLLEHVGLADAARRRVGTYSKGMRQRLGLAQALLGKPAVLLLDEPTTGLDPALRQHFYELLEALRVEGTTILMSSHALTELESKVDRVIIANRGRVIADGSIEALRDIARLPVTLRIGLREGATPPTIADLAWRGTGGNRFEAQTMADAKLALIRRIVAVNGDLTDLDVIAPTLDELYAHFLNGEACAAPAADRMKEAAE